jgi:hypothetical protein
MTEEELKRIERRWNGDDNPGYMVVSSGDVHALIAEVRRLKSKPTEEMFAAARAVRAKREKQVRENPQFYMCGCLGPIPLCRCAERALSEEYLAMVNAAAEPSLPKP